MKDEIKRKIKGYVYNEDDEKKILDYITNLQEELQYQKEAELEYNDKHTKLMKVYSNLQEENVVLKSQLLQDNKSYYDMKDRIKKAIEYINTPRELDKSLAYAVAVDKLLNILQGKSDE